MNAGLRDSLAQVQELPLPEPVVQGVHPETGEWRYGYTADQMREYGASCAALSRPQDIPLEAVAWAVYGTSDEFGDVLLHDYVGSMRIIRNRVMEAARREGFDGNFVERMADLGWWVEPLFAAPKSVRDAARAGERG